MKIDSIKQHSVGALPRTPRFITPGFTGDKKKSGNQI